MAGFDLAKSPFAVLGATPQDSRAQIAAAYEEALWANDDPGHERALDIARNELLAPSSRLEAELAYFLNLDAAASSTLVGGSADGTGETAEYLGSLDRCNLLAHRCANGGGALSTRIRRAKALLHSHDTVSFEEVRSQLAVVRRRSGFGAVSDEDLRAALRNLRRRHAEAIVGTLADDSSGIDAIAGFVEGFTNATAGRQELVEAMLGAYETYVGHRIEAGAQTVREKLAELADSEGKSFTGFEQALRDWDHLAQPLQLAACARGIDETHSRDLLGDIRSTLIDLANEKSQHTPVLRAARLAREIFAELPVAAKALDEDIKTLGRIIADNERAAKLAPLEAAVEKAETKLDRLRSQLKRGFGIGSGDLVMAIYMPLQEIAAANDRPLFEAALWTVRGLALKIQKESDDNESALAVTQGLLALKGTMQTDVANALLADKKTLKGNIDFAALKSALDNRQLDRAAQLVNEMMPDADADLAQSLTQIREAICKRREEGRAKLIGWGVIAAIALIIGVASNSNKPSTSSSTYEPSTVATEAGADAASTAEPTNSPSEAASPLPAMDTASTDDGSETEPGPYTAGALSISELRYCRRQSLIRN